MATSDNAAIRAHGLVKRLGNFCAVDGIDFDVAEGGFFGFLGPNGAGKTTTISMLTGLARPDSGRIEVGGIAALKNCSICSVLTVRQTGSFPATPKV